MCDKISIPRDFIEIRNYTYDERKVQNWRTFMNIFNKFSTQWIFRGQGLGYWPLVSSIERQRELRNWGWEGIENCFIKHFKAKISKKFKKYFDPQNNLEWLSLIQHYGGVTGLLDWTSCPYIATFFAFNDGVNIDTIKKRTGLPACLIKKFFERVGKRTLINTADNLICCDQFEEKVKNSNIIEGTKKKLLEFKYCAVWAVNSQWVKKWAYSRITSVQQYRNLSIPDITNPQNFDTLFFKSPALLKKFFVLPVCPDINKSNFLNKRMRIQKGLFLRQSDVTDSFENNLIFEEQNNYPSQNERKAYIKKFLIPRTSQIRAEVLQELAKKNINKKYLFPGRDIFRDECKKVMGQLKNYALQIKKNQRQMDGVSYLK